MSNISTEMIDSFILDINGKPGLYGLYAVSGLGKTGLLMYFCHKIVKAGKGTPLVFSLEMSEEYWRKRMISHGLCSEGFKVVDTPAVSVSDIEKWIKKYTPSIVFIDYMHLINDSDTIKKLKMTAENNNTAIVVAANLVRNCGDLDPMYRRPQLMDLVWAYDKKKTIEEFLDDMRSYNAILLLHRNHDCRRGIGTAYCYNICDTAEIKVYRNYAWEPPFSLYFDYGMLKVSDQNDG